MPDGVRPAPAGDRGPRGRRVSDTTRCLRVTVENDRWRALLNGPLGMMQTLALVVAVQHFHADANAKAALAGAGSVGHLAAPLVLVALSAWAVGAARAQAWLLAGSGAGLALAALTDGLGGFIAGVAAAVMLNNASLPCVTSYWSQNAGAGRTGRWFGGAVRWEVAGTIASTLAAAWWMGDDAGRYRPVLLACAAALAAAAWFSARIPSGPLRASGRNPLRALAWLWRDPAFGWVVLAWSVMGFANLMCAPLRTEYLANPAHGLGYAPRTIALMLALPMLVRMLALPWWGRMFDRAPFTRMRALVNLAFVAAMACFFTPWLASQLLGILLFGIAFAGGDIAWNLWVYRIAPVERVNDYQAVHISLAGLRGLLAPLAAFHLIAALPLIAVVWLGVGLILLSTLMLTRRRSLP